MLDLPLTAREADFSSHIDPEFRAGGCRQGALRGDEQNFSGGAQPTGAEEEISCKQAPLRRRL